MFSAVKRTLCELVLAAGTFGMVGCNITPTTAPKEFAEEIAENVLQHEVDYFNNSQYSTLIDLITKRKTYIDAENRRIAEQFRNSGILTIAPELKTGATERTMAALGYAMLGDYPNSRVEFTLLMNDFKNDPIRTVEDMEKLQKLFAGEQYKKAENKAISGTIFYSEMNAVVGFLKFARKDYESARRYFKAAIPHFAEETVRDYRNAFKILLIDAAEKGADNNTILEYSKTVYAVCSVKGKEPEKNQN